MQLPTATPQPSRSFGKRFLLLFFTVYFIFLFLDFTSSDELFPRFVYILLKPYIAFWDWLVPWSGKYIFHIPYPITVKPNGSGDTTYNYVLQALWLILAIVIAGIWAVFDRHRMHYRNLAYWLRIALRYYFAYMLFAYGFVKVIKLQFPAPDLLRLTQPYGNSSPMGLAWTFVGYSSGYNVFIGGAEVLAGLLLFFKRTTLLGALLAFSIMSNVAAMNFAYDIPVKIFSLNLVVISVFLAAYDWERIRNVFFLNRPAPAALLAMPQPRRWKRLLQKSLKALAIIFALHSTLWMSVINSRQYGDAAPKPALYGIYNVESFVRNGDTLPPLTTDTTRWKQVIFNYKDYVRIANMTDSLQWLTLHLDTTKHTMQMVKQDSSVRYHFIYTRPDKEHLVFTGGSGKDSSRIVMKRFDEQQFRLISRGFHWINEHPYNK